MRNLILFFSLTFALVAIGHAQAPTVGLMVYYPFNGNANDESGNGIDGTVNGATLTSDRFANENSAYSFNGVDNYIEVPNHNLLGVGAGGNVTVCLWLRTTNTNPWGAISKYSSGAWPVGGFSISADSGVYFDGRDRHGYRFSGRAQTNLHDGDWHFAVGMRSCSIWSIWVDGVMEADTDAADMSAMDNAFSLIIGASSDGGSIGGYFAGEIDDIRIYMRALDQDEIMSLYAIPGSARNEGALPANLNLNQNYPNPFNPSTTITYAVKIPGQYSLHVYDVTGRLVTTLFDDFRPIGEYSSVWDGENALGTPVASGGYYYTLQSSHGVIAKQMLLLK